MKGEKGYECIFGFMLHITGGIIDNIFMCRQEVYCILQITGGIIDNIFMETGGLLT